MATIGKVPVYLRVGDSDEIRIGEFELHVDGNGTVPTPTSIHMASMLRQAADQLDNGVHISSFDYKTYMIEREKAVVDLVRRKADHFGNVIAQVLYLASQLDDQVVPQPQHTQA